jgi:hypothetical protein
MSDDVRTLIACPACDRGMALGGRCVNCGHEDDGACTCDHCLMAEDDEDSED